MFNRIGLPIFLVLMLLLAPLWLPIAMVYLSFLSWKYKFEECPNCRGKSLTLLGYNVPHGGRGGRNGIEELCRREKQIAYYRCETCGSLWKHSFGEYATAASQSEL